MISKIIGQDGISSDLTLTDGDEAEHGSLEADDYMYVPTSTSSLDSSDDSCSKEDLEVSHFYYAAIQPKPNPLTIQQSTDFLPALLDNSTHFVKFDTI